MNKPSSTPQQERGKTAEIYHGFINDSIDALFENCEIYQAIASLRKVRYEWTNTLTTEKQFKLGMLILQDIHEVETLLLDMAEATARYNQAILNTYEQAPD